MNQYEILKHYFGYDTFRDGQEKLIGAIRRKRCPWHHANGGRKVPLLSDTGTYDGRDHTCGFASYILNERPGKQLKPGWYPGSLFKQFSYAWSI